MGCYMKIEGDTLEVNKCFGSLRRLAELWNMAEEEKRVLDDNRIEIVDHGDWFSVDFSFWGHVAYSTASDFRDAVEAFAPWLREPAWFRSWVEDFDSWDKVWLASTEDRAKLAESKSEMEGIILKSRGLLPDHLDHLIKELQAIRSKRKREAKKAALEIKTCPVN